MKYTAVVLAGSRPGRDQFAEQFGTDLKALISVAGEPMVRRPVEALLACESIGDITVLSQAPERVAAVVGSDSRVVFRGSRGTIADTMLELCDDPSLRWPVLVTTADHALLNPLAVEEFIRGAGSVDVAVAVVERTVLMRRLPNARRTWLKFRGGAYTGANLFALKSPAVRPAIDLWRSVEQDRKKAWRVVSLLGPTTLVLAGLRLLNVHQVIARLGRKLGLELKAVELTDPLAGVDVDKPSDHALVEAILAGKA